MDAILPKQIHHFLYLQLFPMPVQNFPCWNFPLFCVQSFVFYDKHPTARVTRWWAGRDNAALAEPTLSQENCLKTRRLPPVGCTLCWLAFIDKHSTPVHEAI